MAKYLVLNGKRMSKARMCNILNDLEKCYFEPIDYDYKLMVDVFVRWMRSLDDVSLYRALVHIYKFWLIDDLLAAFDTDVEDYYAR